MAQYIEPRVETKTPGGVLSRDAITIGESLESASLAVGEKEVEQSDAAAIQAAEVRATGMKQVLPGGIGAQAQSAAYQNSGNSDKTTISDILAVHYYTIYIGFLEYCAYIENDVCDGRTRR